MIRRRSLCPYPLKTHAGSFWPVLMQSKRRPSATRRAAWWVVVDGVSKDEIMAFTFRGTQQSPFHDRRKRCADRMS